MAAVTSCGRIQQALHGAWGPHPAPTPRNLGFGAGGSSESTPQVRASQKLAQPTKHSNSLLGQLMYLPLALSQDASAQKMAKKKQKK